MVVAIHPTNRSRRFSDSARSMSQLLMLNKAVTTEAAATRITLAVTIIALGLTRMPSIVPSTCHHDTTTCYAWSYVLPASAISDKGNCRIMIITDGRVT